MKTVLVAADGFFHPPLFARRALKSVLHQLEGFSFSAISSLEQLPENLGEFDALVVYLHHKTLSAAALEKLDSFVANGGGLLGIHSATASYKQTAHYFEILGGRFTGHGKVEPFTVAPLRRTDVFHDIPAFEVVDELYFHETQPGIEVHFVTRQKDEEVPVVWTYAYGRGRVCYAVPGHRTATMNSAAYQTLLKQGVRWVANA